MAIGGGVWAGGGVGGGGGGLRGRGQGTFHPPCHYCTTTWCFALKGLRTTTNWACIRVSFFCVEGGSPHLKLDERRPRADEFGHRLDHDVHEVEPCPDEHVHGAPVPHEDEQVTNHRGQQLPEGSVSRASQGEVNVSEMRTSFLWHSFQGENTFSLDLVDRD